MLCEYGSRIVAETCNAANASEKSSESGLAVCSVLSAAIARSNYG
ncbi:hypothetical protein [Leptolyngbya sp. FACHB-321]|nr:hypothetical protein [Leptolyngbya sp. FACHB-321]